MNFFNKSIFKDLAAVHEPHCVSIYIPTHRAGGPEGIKKDKIRLKNQLKEAVQKLEIYELSKPQVEEYLRPVRDLLENEYIWSHMSDGLMIFLYGENMDYYQVPVDFSEQCHVESSLYLLPAIPLLTDSARHFIMALSLNEVRLFQATRHSISRVDVSELVPEGMTESVGEDYEQASLQFRSGQGESQDAAIYHGQGAGEMPEKKKEVAKYFQDVDKGIMKILHDEKAPLVIACVDYLFPIYQDNNSYDYLENEFVKGNHDETNPEKLREAAWELIGDRFDKDRETEISKFEKQLSAAAASFNEQEVIPAGIIGQAETLFVRKGTEVWGRYDKETHKIDIDSMPRTGNAELVNKAAIETVKHGGKVLHLESDEMPEEMGEVAATYRYTI